MTQVRVGLRRTSAGCRALAFASGRFDFAGGLFGILQYRVWPEQLARVGRPIMTLYVGILPCAVFSMSILVGVAVSRRPG